MAGGWLIFGLGGFVAIVCGVALLGLALSMRPRLGRLPRDVVVIEPVAAPRLYATVNAVAERLGARPIWRIVLVADFNAGFGEVGFRRRPILYLGYPLWNVLSPEERIAVLGHEIGHSVNGDAQRGLLVGSSLTSLTDLYRTMRPDSGVTMAGDSVLVAVSEAIAKAVMWVLSWPVLGMIHIQERLLAQSGQRAEYYADHLAATVAGSRAATSALDLLRLGGPCMRDLHTAIVRREPDIWAASRSWVSGLDPAERARLTERADAERPRVDASHPATCLRIDAIAARTYADGAVAVAADPVIDDELRSLLRPVTEEVRAMAIR